MKINFLVAFFLITGVIQAQIPNYVPLNGLQGFWPFTGNANDITANAYQSTIFGALPTQDRFGNPNSAYSFNGVSDYIVSTYSGIQGTGARAVSFWAKKFNNSTSSAVSWGGNAQGTRYDCMFNYAGAGPTADCAYGAITYQGAGNPDDNTWHHYVYQFSGTDLTDVVIFMDGVMLTSIVSTYNPSTPLVTNNDFNVTFGRVYFTPYLYMYGCIDEIGIWNRTLTMCEIKTLYASSLNTTPQLATTQASFCTGQVVTYTVTGATSFTWAGGATSPTNTFTMSPGTVISVAAINATTGCVATLTLAPKVVNCTGIEEQENTRISLSPNPANNKISVTGLSISSKVVIIDCAGRTVLMANENYDAINIANLAEGLYTIVISNTETNARITQKLVIQR